MLAVHREQRFQFDTYTHLTYLDGLGIVESKLVHPLTINVSSRGQLDKVFDELNNLFCGTCSAERLWLRGQRQEYPLPRPADLCQKLYGSPYQASLLPSAGRFAVKNPGKMGFGFALSGPHNPWKKPFLIWMMRENSDWFRRAPRALDVLSRVLSDEDDESFVKLLIDLQMPSKLTGLADPTEDIAWPDEADDLRQWFFAFMKPHSFGITLQQYGYISTLLDLTEDIDVALYFSQAEMTAGRMRKQSPKDGRLIYVFAERRSGDFFRHGRDLFWGDYDWVRRLPPRLERQKAGFLKGSTSRTRNFYNNMVVARIYLEGESLETTLEDNDLFPGPESDMLYRTLLDSRPKLDGLY